MTTPAKLQANRRNAQFSTGPRTAEGKATSAFNAQKHGLCSRRLLLPGESPEEFEAFKDSLWAHIGPVGALEEFFVGRVVEAGWRLRRVAGIEAGLLGEELHQLLGGTADAFRGNSTPLANLDRHEGSLERALIRALHQLERLQAHRAGLYVPPPAALDVNVDVAGREELQNEPNLPALSSEQEE